jgi:hypothetical protein
VAVAYVNSTREDYLDMRGYFEETTEIPQSADIVVDKFYFFGDAEGVCFRGKLVARCTVSFRALGEEVVGGSI